MAGRVLKDLKRKYGHTLCGRIAPPGLEGQTHNLAAEPAAAMAKEFFLGR